MSGPHTDNTTYPSANDAPHQTLDPATLHDRRLTVCDHAHGPDDARRLLQMLGLVTTPTGAQA